MIADRTAGSCSVRSADRTCLIIVVPDGRGCKFCGCKDSDDDPVDKALGILTSEGKCPTMAWFMDKPIHGKKNEGNSCFYCVCVFQSRYKHKVSSQAALLKDLGSSESQMASFRSLKDACIQYYIDHDGRSARLEWAEIDRIALNQVERAKLSYQEPVDEHWDYDLYVAEKGDPQLNNHKILDIGDRKVFRLKA